MVIGSGGREHALAWKLSQSSKVKEVFVVPGNGGTALEKKCRNIQLNSFPEMINFAKENEIDFTVVGPEQPLSEGIVDEFESFGLEIFGPTKKATLIESSKVFAKELMKENNIPSAEFEVFDEAGKAIEFVKEFHSNELVVKADGLAAGKGVSVCSSKEEAIDAVNSIMNEKIFGGAGNKVIVEERLKGEEASILAFTDSKTIITMISSQDHKPVFDNDSGPNTGGMGAYAPAPIVTEEVMEKTMNQVFLPAMKGLKEKGIKYKGVIYAGLMISEGELNLLEFNARFGDPETQPILSLLETDLLEAIEAVINENLNEIELKWSSNAACCVMLASKGYPLKYEKGKEINGLNEVEKMNNVKVFHSGTKLEGEKILTTGGRVLGVTGIAPTIRESINTAYSAVEKIHFNEMHYRKDIGRKALKDEEIK
ncbi:MAG: phosphoribosylamine--glycine ligase [archaeon]